MAAIKLKGEPRKVTGRKVKTLRREGLVPANIFGKKMKSSAISVDLKEFQNVFKEAGETSLVELQVAKDKTPVLIRNVQSEPVSGDILHVDFQKVDLKEKVTAEVPVEIVGESPAEKQGIGTLVQHLSEIEVECLPADIPEKFEIDATTLTDVDQAVLVKHLKIDESKIKIETNPEEIVAKVEALREEEPEPVAPAETAEGEAAAPSEGEEAAPAAEQNSEEK